MAYLISKCEFDGFKVADNGLEIYVSSYLPHKKSAGLNIYDLNGSLLETISFTDDLFMGDVIACKISKLSLKDKAYRFVKDGEEVIDPASRNIIGNNVFGKVMSEKKLYSTLANKNNPKGWEKDSILKIPYSEAVMYVTHIRGLTMADPSVKSDNGTFKGASKKAKAIKKLGITSVIFMPVYERIEHIKASYANGLSYKNVNNDMPLNYWGFGPGFYYALKSSYASEDPSFEFKKMVKTYHDLGLEVILTFDFCNMEYERISEILRYWIFEYHIDGFRIFGTNEFGRFINDPFLKDTKLIFEKYFDELNSLKPVLYKNIAIVDKEFRNNVRKFLKSDDDCVGFMSNALKENHNSYAVIRNITDFDGLTLNDLVSYDRKHNDANNEDGKDGTNYNFSWNCGVEGPTNKKNVIKLRNKQIRNALMLVFLCQGTPMIAAGDEFLNSCEGNNNPYCQDNEIGWVTYNNSKDSKAIYKFLMNLIDFRKKHVILHQPFELKGFDYLSCKMPDVSFHSDEAWKIYMNPDSREFSYLLGGDYSKQYTGKKEASLLITFNLHWEERNFWMPLLPKGYEWVMVMSSDLNESDFETSKLNILAGEYYKSNGRNISVFMSQEMP